MVSMSCMESPGVSALHRQASTNCSIRSSLAETGVPYHADFMTFSTLSWPEDLFRFLDMCSSTHMNGRVYDLILCWYASSRYGVGKGVECSQIGLNNSGARPFLLLIEQVGIRKRAAPAT